MTFITKTNQTFESAQPIALPEEPIRTISPEILESILFLTNQSESTRLVSRDWNDLTVTAFKYPRKQELTQTIQLIIEKLNPDTQAQGVARLAALQDSHHFYFENVATFAKIQEAFLIVKGLLVGILRKLPEAERDQLQNEIGDQLPESMKDIFEISKLELKYVRSNIDPDTFFTLVQSYQPLSMEDRGIAVEFAALLKSKIEFVKLLLACGPISEDYRGLAVMHAARNNNLELANLLLANGPILEDLRGCAVFYAAENNNLELANLLLANGPISDYRRGRAVKIASRENNLEIVKVLLAHGPISLEDRNWAILEATFDGNLELAWVLTNKWVVVELGVGAVLLGGIAWFGYKVYSEISELRSSIAENQARTAELQASIAELKARTAEILARSAEIQARTAARL